MMDKKPLRIFHLSILLLSGLLLLSACTDIYELDKYQKPDWLAGKLYTQLSEQENLVKFAEAMRLVGFDTIVDVTGSFTIFAPTDQAMDQFLADNQYATVSDVPGPELEKIIRFHIIQNAWSTKQLRTLDVDGWIDPTNPRSQPKAYKRQTLLKNPNEKYWVSKRKNEDVIVIDSTESSDFRLVHTRSRKYVPIFFDEFFEINSLNTDDYEFYFNRSYEGGQIFYAGAKVIQSEIFAENGFIYVVDKVVRPMMNARELLEQEYQGQKYHSFLELVYQYPRFTSDLEETYKQPAARAGGTFDTLFNLTFPKLPFDIHEELTGPNINVSNYTYLYHNALFVPTDQAFQKLLDEVVTARSGFPHWPDFQSVPNDVKQLIVNAHITTGPVYYSDITNGFQDEEGNIIYLNEGDIVQKEYGTNCTFIGLSEAVVPRAFSSVTGAVYLRPGYSVFMYAMQLSKVQSAITKSGQEYAFFPLPDDAVQQDSSLMLEWIDKELGKYRMFAFDRGEERKIRMSPGVLGKRILNQVGTSIPTGSADKEFIETLGGNYIIWNNADQTVQGTRPSIYGYRGDSVITVHPTELEEASDNGRIWSVNSWFINSRTEMFGAIYAGYPAFSELLEQAGLYDPVLYRFPFLTEGENYTIFVPSAEALENYRADTLPDDELAQFLKYHFVKGEKIFTDNKKNWKEYKTLRKDESSTEFSAKFSTLNIRPGPDVIDILNPDGSLYVSIPEAGSRTNIMVATDTDPESNDETDFIITSVIHEIDTVLVKK